MKRVATLIVVLMIAAVAPFAGASDLRHLRFASTPSQAATPNVAVRTSAQPYSLTGHHTRVLEPSAAAKNTWVVGSPQFRPGK